MPASTQPTNTNAGGKGDDGKDHRSPPGSEHGKGAGSGRKGTGKGKARQTTAEAEEEKQELLEEKRVRGRARREELLSQRRRLVHVLVDRRDADSIARVARTVAEITTIMELSAEAADDYVEDDDALPPIATQDDDRSSTGSRVELPDELNTEDDSDREMKEEESE